LRHRGVVERLASWVLHACGVVLVGREATSERFGMRGCPVLDVGRRSLVLSSLSTAALSLALRRSAGIDLLPHADRLPKLGLRERRNGEDALLGSVWTRRIREVLVGVLILV